MTDQDLKERLRELLDAATPKESGQRNLRVQSWKCVGRKVLAEIERLEAERDSYRQALSVALDRTLTLKQLLEGGKQLREEIDG